VINPDKISKISGIFSRSIVIDDEKCTKCGLCVRTCPVAALTME
jgi:NAD-dependent dihydropyrimidine dehydrogenase PreA subunit